MSRTHWKFARVCGVIAVSILLYLLLRVKNYSYNANVFLPNAHPNEVWEFVADFSNMKHLNPTIEDFKITDEIGNYKHWKYTVEYKEHLSHWPNLPNYAVAKFSIRADLSQTDKFFINSLHTTCLINNFLCLDSESEFVFTNGNSSKGAFCEEKVIYQCPAFFFSFCRREVEYQRKAIMYNLKNHFS
ncbi:hypothetical protein WA026_022740 [Henosepilachna vigintioctopunctata]|uniref:Uncharacterized protein n=1 Tax=Henosepilachna vigintioctopunctata TaxID=420089 RepID=A0AAW1UNF5_9CUCU